MDKGYGKIKYVNLKDAKFVLSCTKHKDEPPMELSIAHPDSIPKCPKCSPGAQHHAIPKAALTLIEQEISNLLNSCGKITTGTEDIEVRIELLDSAIKERNR